MHRHDTQAIRSSYLARRLARLGAKAALLLCTATAMALFGGSTMATLGGNSFGATVFATNPAQPAPLNPGDYDPGKQYKDCANGRCILRDYIQPALNMLAALVGLAVTISFIAAGIRYASSADNPQKVSEAKQRMVTAVFVLIGFFTFYAVMNYLIPGGI